MSCFAVAGNGMPPPSPPQRRARQSRNWRWWWRRCVGLSAAVRSRLRRRRRAAQAQAPPLQSGRCHHRILAAQVYVDELCSEPKNLAVVHEEEKEEEEEGDEEQTTTSNGKAAERVSATAGAGGHGKIGGGVRRSVWLSPGRGGGAGGMGEVDVRAELFIRRFREEMRLQTQRSAEELQAMLARGL